MADIGISNGVTVNPDVGGSSIAKSSVQTDINYIKNETEDGRNTASRIGAVLTRMLNFTDQETTRAMNAENALSAGIVDSKSLFTYPYKDVLSERDLSYLQNELSSMENGTIRMYGLYKLSAIGQGYAQFTQDESSWLFGSTSPVGYSLGDVLVLVKHTLLNGVGTRAFIIHTQDAKAANGSFVGADGVESIWDKSQINKIPGLESTLNSLRNMHLTKSGQNMDECLEGGFYPWCTSGRPEGADCAFTLVTDRSADSDSNGYYTIRQTCYGRWGDFGGRSFVRIIYWKDAENKDFGAWQELTHSIVEYAGVIDDEITLETSGYGNSVDPSNVYYSTHNKRFVARVESGSGILKGIKYYGIWVGSDNYNTADGIADRIFFNRGNITESEREKIDQCATVIDLLDYMGEGMELPTINAVFVYHGRVVRSREVVLHETKSEYIDGRYGKLYLFPKGTYLAFCVSWSDEKIGLIEEYSAYRYDTSVNKYVFVAGFSKNINSEISNLFSSAFGTSLATTKQAGFMSPTDKRKLDEIGYLMNTGTVKTVELNPSNKAKMSNLYYLSADYGFEMAWCDYGDIPDQNKSKDGYFRANSATIDLASKVGLIKTITIQIKQEDVENAVDLLVTSDTQGSVLSQYTISGDVKSFSCDVYARSCEITINNAAYFKITLTYCEDTVATQLADVKKLRAETSDKVIFGRAIGKNARPGSRYYFKDGVFVKGFNVDGAHHLAEQNSGDGVWAVVPAGYQKKGFDISKGGYADYALMQAVLRRGGADNPLIVTIPENFDIEEFIKSESYYNSMVKYIDHNFYSDTVSPNFKIKGGLLVCVKEILRTNRCASEDYHDLIKNCNNPTIYYKRNQSSAVEIEGEQYRYQESRMVKLRNDRFESDIPRKARFLKCVANVKRRGRIYESKSLPLYIAKREFPSITHDVRQYRIVQA